MEGARHIRWFDGIPRILGAAARFSAVLIAPG